eukprot:3410199-Alexandrium_andersonii.AAC.1
MEGESSGHTKSREAPDSAMFSAQMPTLPTKRASKRVRVAYRGVLGGGAPPGRRSVKSEVEP